MYVIACLLFKYVCKGLSVSIISESLLQLPDGITYIKTEPGRYVFTAEQIGTDVLITKNSVNPEEQAAIERTNLKVILWGHNYYFSDYAQWVSQTRSIKANVFVGKQQYDRYIDHDIITKSLTIFNMLPDFLGERVCRKNDGKTVVYMGALVPVKGFLEMAKMWKSIVQAVPEAQLLVMGTGSLYTESKDAKWGSLGIADEEFEKQFLPYVTDEHRNLLPSVKFLGKVGVEKYDYFRNASVGVVNPSARTEIFSVSIMEMALASLPVVTLNKNGFPDSIDDGVTGYLCLSQKEIQSKIIMLLKDKEHNNRLGDAAKKRVKEFAPEKIIEQWKSLIYRVYKNELVIPYSSPIPPFSNNLKWIRCVLRTLRFTLGLKFIPPFINVETWVYNQLKKRNG